MDMNTSTIIYAIKCNDTVKAFCTDRQVAIDALKIKRNSIAIRGVTFTKDEEDVFEFYFGWEEWGARWWIQPVQASDDIKVIASLLGV